MSSFEVVGDKAIVKLNSSLYPLRIVYSAAYVMLDKAYFLFDGEPEGEIIVNIYKKKNEDISLLAQEFLDQLVNYGVFRETSLEQSEVKQAVIQKVLLEGKDKLVSWEKIYGNNDKDKGK